MKLKRYPHRKHETLQAWDSADELILAHLRDQGGDLSSRRILILNDSFGALSCGLEGQDITSYTDSYVASRAIQLNSQDRIQPLHRLEDITGEFDLMLARIPKNLSFFEDLLCRLTHHLKPGAQIVCGAMIKHLAKSSFDLLNRYIGETRTSLAQKKARLIFADFKRAPMASPYPLSVQIEGFPHPFVHHSGLFSREKLDIGTRFLLEHIPQGDFKNILDLGCANGIIGIAAKQRNPSARIIFSDESWMAVQSAMANYRNYFADDSAEFHWGNCYEDQAPGSVDLVICNPPFHQGNTLGDFIAWQMFTDSFHALVPGGRIRVIGNSHLRYPIALKKIFGNSRVVATNSKFTVVDAVK